MCLPPSCPWNPGGLSPGASRRARAVVTAESRNCVTPASGPDSVRGAISEVAPSMTSESHAEPAECAKAVVRIQFSHHEEHEGEEEEEEERKKWMEG